MELTKDALRDVSFRARGKWYRGEDVDGFLAELMVALDEAEREKQELEDDVRRLERELHAAKEETEHLKQHLTETLQAPQSPGTGMRRAGKERDELIESTARAGSREEFLEQGAGRCRRNCAEHTAAAFRPTFIREVMRHGKRRRSEPNRRIFRSL